MKAIRNFVVVAACLVSVNVAFAQFGNMLGAVGGKSSSDSGGDVAGEVSKFIVRSAALGELSSRSVTAINAAFSSDEEIAKKRAKLDDISKITDTSERNAKSAALYESESAEGKRRMESGEMEKLIGGLDDAKKKQIGAALLNFGIGALQAVDLTKVGQNIMQKTAGNPMNMGKVVPVKDSLPLLAKVAGDAGGFMAGVLKLAKGANISVPPVTSDSKPANIAV